MISNQLLEKICFYTSFKESAIQVRLVIQAKGLCSGPVDKQLVVSAVFQNV